MFDYAVSPFLSLTHGNLKDAEKKIEDVLPELNKDSMTVVPQILGHEVEEFVELSNRLYELGYNEVNWNMGCPMRRVAGKHRGSGILPYPDEVREILEYVVPRIKPQLSVKMRLGYRSSSEIDHIIPILNDYPIKDVTVHPRIGKQMYSGLTDVERFAQILPQIHHKVIYNGDICSVYDYKKIRQRFPSVKDVMIGRGALYNPALPLQIRMECEDDFERADIVFEGCEKNKFEEIEKLNSRFVVSLMTEILSLDSSNESKCRKMKEYWCLLSKALPGSEELKRRVLHADVLDDIFSMILEMTK